MRTAVAVIVGLVGTIVSLLVLDQGLQLTTRISTRVGPSFGSGALIILAAGLLLGGVLLMGRRSWWSPLSSAVLLAVLSAYAVVAPLGILGALSGAGFFFAYQLGPLLAVTMLAGSLACRTRTSKQNVDFGHAEGVANAQHPAYDLVVGSTKQTLVRRLGEPTGGRPPSSGLNGEEYWLYQDAPSGHDTQIVVGARGLIESVEVVPHQDNLTGRARHVVSAPGRQQPMAELWAKDRESVLGGERSIALVLAEFAETFQIEDVEHDLTKSQKSQRCDGDRLDKCLDRGEEQPVWLRTPLAIRQIGRELDKRGGFSRMQSSYYQARGAADSPGKVSIVELLWDGIGRWER